MRKEVILYTKFINDRYKYLQLLNNGLNNAIKNRNVKMCKIINEEINKDIEIIELLVSLIEQKDKK